MWVVRRYRILLECSATCREKQFDHLPLSHAIHWLYVVCHGNYVYSTDFLPTTDTTLFTTYGFPLLLTFQLGTVEFHWKSSPHRGMVCQNRSKAERNCPPNTLFNPSVRWCNSSEDNVLLAEVKACITFDCPSSAYLKRLVGTVRKYLDSVIDVLLFLPRHYRKTILFHSTRDILRGRYTEKKMPYPQRLKSAVPGMENQDLSISEFIGLERRGSNLHKFCAKGHKLGELYVADTLSRGWRLFLAEVHTDLQCSASYQDSNICYSYYLAFFPSTQLWSISSNTI